jgi:DNA-binding NarL/FixJ family response regulator
VSVGSGEEEMGQKIRILLIDDHDLFRESLSRLLDAEPDFQIAGNCASVSAAFSILEREQVDIVLLDYDLGVEVGSRFLEESFTRNLQCKILTVTAAISDEVTLNLLENGSSGIFFKHSPPGQLIEAIHKVMAGQPWLDARTMQIILATAAAKKEHNKRHALNLRERLVLKSVFEGLSNKGIAASLNITEGSVKAVIQQLFDKTGVRTRSQLVRIALEKGIQNWPSEPEP